MDPNTNDTKEQAFDYVAWRTDFLEVNATQPHYAKLAEMSMGDLIRFAHLSEDAAEAKRLADEAYGEYEVQMEAHRDSTDAMLAMLGESSADEPVTPEETHD